MNTTRRNIFRFAAGASAGIVFTPAPWKLLDDTAIWSQNWSWIPRPLRGEITERVTACTLCPSGCAVKARCVAGQPYSLVGLDRALCPAGIGAHQLPYAPGRIRRATLHGDPVALDKALPVVSDRIAKAGSIAVLDSRPTRAVSDVYRAIAATDSKWHHVTPSPLPTYAIDPGKATLILSFGAPVLHNWQMPAAFLTSRNHYKLIQIEPVQSRTAAFADTWLPIRPGTEAVMANAIASILRKDNRTTLAEAEQITGIDAGRIDEIARAFATAPCALAIAAADPRGAVLELNLLIGDRAALATPPARPSTPDLESLPDYSIDVLFIDNTPNVPLPTVRRKLNKEATVVLLAAFPSEWSKLADIVIPTPTWLESQEDVPEALDSPRATFRLAAAILKPAPETIPAPDFIARAAGHALTTAETIEARIASLHKAGKGTIKEQPLSAMTLEDFKAALAEGAAWQSAASPTTHAPLRAPAQALLRPIPLPPVPQLAKLTQETTLYQRSHA